MFKAEKAPYNTSITVRAAGLGDSVSGSFSFIVLPDEFIKELGGAISSYSKTHCSSYVSTMSSAPSSGVICGGDYLGRGYITFSIPYAAYVTDAYFNITASDNRTDLWVNGQSMGAYDCGDNDWQINETRDITQLVRNSNGQITVKVEKWCRGGCGFNARIVAHYQ